MAESSDLPHPPLVWSRECVTCDQSSLAGYRVAIYVAPNGFPHLVYTDIDGITYAYQDSAGWHFETVQDRCFVSDHLFLRLGLDGQKHILFQCDSLHISYAFYDETGWHAQEIFDYSDFIWNTFFEAQILEINSLALDTAGRPHATVQATFNQVTSMIFYLGLTDSGWQAELVGPGEDGAVALDAGGLPHVARAYRVWDNNKVPIDSFLEYSYRDEHGWHSEEIAHPPTGLDVAIAIDSLGRPHIVTDGGVQPGNYYRKDDSGWTRQTVAVAAHPFLVLDAQDTPTIGSHNEYVVIYATLLPGGWYTRFFERQDFYYSDAGMALDSQGKPHFAYREFTSRNVTYLHPYSGTVYSLYLPAIQN